ncbi:small integral membrane protein 29-like [Dunckerocampus dactyliophorus]|uniref:small integral membrane protein 29-like n=1 Tax=Dunckerocampus dactyliophorus TaxID=161453 RepID=UPI002404C30E|nr:small integral membrane protein 29-like [Dunckerocampus dactyliophorus]
MKMHPNHTTPHISPPNTDNRFVACAALIPLVILTLVGCATALVLYIKRRMRLDELRHRLIPVYSYDPAEEDHAWDHGALDSEEELTEPLCKDGRSS